MKSGNLNFLELSGPLRACNRNALPLQINLLLKHEYILLVNSSHDKLFFLQSICELLKDMLNYWRICWITEGHAELLKDMLNYWRTCWITEGHAKLLKDMLNYWRTCWITEGHAELLKDMLNYWRTCWITEGHAELLKDMLNYWRTCWITEGYAEFHIKAWKTNTVDDKLSRNIGKGTAMPSWNESEGTEQKHGSSVTTEGLQKEI